MNELELKALMDVLMKKSPLILHELNAELRTLAFPELTDAQQVVVENAIQGALISGMKLTMEKTIK